MRVSFKGLLLVPLAFSMSSTVTATVWHVNPDGTGDAPTIQAAIDSAAAGDTVSLAYGTYTGDGNRDIDYHGKAIVIRSAGGDPDSCVIDSRGFEPGRPHCGFRFRSGEDSTSVVLDLTIIAPNDIMIGDAVDCYGASPTFDNCVFDGTAGFGRMMGGLAFYGNSASKITGCRIQNFWYYSGGAVWCSDSPIVIIGSLFLNNRNTDAGAIVGSPCEVVDCTFVNNMGELGGAIVGSPGLISNCTFRGNVSHFGGGALHGHPGRVVNCDFIENRAERESGGAVQGASSFINCNFVANLSGGYGWGSGGAVSVVTSPATFDSCTFVGNETHWSSYDSNGGALCCVYPASATLTNCTFFGNRVLGEEGSGSTIYSDGSPVSCTNCIVAFGIGGEPVECESGGTVALSCCDVFGNQGGDFVGCIADQVGINGNFSADPRFCAPDSVNLTLNSLSPCLPGNHPGGVDCGLIGALGQGCEPGSSSVSPGAGSSEVELGQAVPNPFNPTTRITYWLPREERVTLSIHDVSGHLIDLLVEQIQCRGGYVVEWDASGLASGVYFCRLKAGDEVKARRVVLLK